jgi:hypothetical protein
MGSVRTHRSLAYAEWLLLPRTGGIAISVTNWVVAPTRRRARSAGWHGRSISLCPGRQSLYMGSECSECHMASPHVGRVYWHDGSDNNGDHRFQLGHRRRRDWNRDAPLS